MTFKDVAVNVGDFVQMQSSTVPLPEFSAVVIGVEDHVLEVLSTLLVPFGHKGFFQEDEVDRIEVVYSAEETIPKETGGKFVKDQEVSTVVLLDGEKVEGKVVAAFDSLLVMRMADGQLITGGIDHFASE